MIGSAVGDLACDASFGQSVGRTLFTARDSNTPKTGKTTKQISVKTFLTATDHSEIKDSNTRHPLAHHTDKTLQHSQTSYLYVFIIESFLSGTFPSMFKTAIVKPLLKKPSLDQDDLKKLSSSIQSVLSFLSC